MGLGFRVQGLGFRAAAAVGVLIYVDSSCPVGSGALGCLRGSGLRFGALRELGMCALQRKPSSLNPSGFLAAVESWASVGAILVRIWTSKVFRATFRD